MAKYTKMDPIMAQWVITIYYQKEIKDNTFKIILMYFLWDSVS